MKKAVLYARVSSDMQQRERSIDSQIAELKKQIDKSGNELINEYVDDGYSGALLDRPAMNKLRDDLKKDLFETIYIINIDRIARDVTYQNIIVGEILKYKKQLIINGKDYIQNSENKFTLTVLGAVAELERAKLIERVMRGRQYKLKQGILLGNGFKTYGYNYIKKTQTSPPRYEVNMHEAKIVQYIFETYAKGQIGTRGIGMQLEKRGLTNERVNFEQSQIKFILKNIAYTGTRYFNRMKVTKISKDILSKSKERVEYYDQSQWIGIQIPAIICKELFDNVQARLQYNQTCWRNSKRIQILSNLVWCGKCESKCFAYQRSYKANKKQYRKVVYKCNSKTPCHNPEIQSQVLESCVFEMINKNLLQPEKLIDQIDLKKNTRRNRSEKQLKAIHEKIVNLNSKKKRILDLYAIGNLEHEDYTNRISTYDKELKVLETKKLEFTSYTPLLQKQDLVKTSVISYVHDLRDKFAECADFETKRQFLLNYLTKITCSRKIKGNMRVRIYGSIPIELENLKIPLTFKIENIFSFSEIKARTPTTLKEVDMPYHGSINLSNLKS